MKAKFLALAALLFGLAACQTDPQGLDVTTGGEQEVMLTVSLPEVTRANSAQGFDLTTLGTNYDIRYILEIYRVENNVVLYDNCQHFVDTSDGTSMVFPVRLAPGYDYRIVAWADIVEEGSEADRYYYTEDGLDNVVIKDNGTVNWNAMDETRDAYTATKLIEDFNSSSDLDMELTRPFAKVRVVATDIDDIRNVGLEPTTATVEYSQNMYVKYNAVEDKCIADGAKMKKHEFAYDDVATEYNDATGEMTLFTDYIFVPQTGTAKFNFVVKDANGNEIKTNNFNTDIFVESNKLTTIKGDVLTTGGNVTIKVENGLGEKETYTYVDNAEDLQQMINNAPENENTNITLGGDIDLNDLLNAGTLSTRAGETAGLVIPANKTVVLDLNGHTLSQTKTQTGKYALIENNGTLTLCNSAEKNGTISYGDNAKLTADVGYASNTIQNNGTLTINDGVTLLNTSGTEVASYGYPHVIDTNGKLTINGGILTNEANYSTMRIWTSNTDAEKCVVVINGGTFNGCIDFQAHNNNYPTIPHYGTLTVNGGTFNADTFTKSAIRVLRFGVNAEDMHATINGGDFYGKVWVRNIGTFDSTPAIFTIKGGSFSTLSPIVYLADNCTYTLNSNVENAEPVKFVGNVTLNLNGHNVSAVDTTETSYGLITNNGNLTITGKGTISLSATEESGWSRYSSVISNGTNGTLVVDKDVVLQHLGGTSMAYGIDVLTNGGIGDSHATVYGTVQSTYRAIRQFLNSDSKMNTLIVKEGAVVESTGGNKAIWMQDPSKKANKGTLTVESGAKVHSVYLDVTEGSTEWPVEVSVAASSLTDTSDNKGIYTDGIPAGYSVINENGVWKVIYTCAAKIGNEEYNSLQAAIEAVEDGETIVLQRDIDIATPAYGQNALNHAKAVNFTLDLNGKTISADTGNSVFRYNISQTDATSNITVTFKNGTITSGDNTWCTVMAAGTSNDVKAIFNLEDLTINASKAGDLAVKAWDYAVINAKNVTVNATKCAGGFYALGGEIVLDNCTVNQEGLHTAPYLSMALAVSNKGKMTVNSGNYTTEPTAAAEGNNQGTSHGSWCAGVMNSGGELIINGGTFANGNFGEDALANYARGLIFGDTASNIVINDGTFNALKTVIDYQNNLGVQPNPNIVINGGNFSANPAVVTSYGGVVLAEGKIAVQGANGRWTLIDGVMDEEGLKAAFEQGGNIVLGADITLAETVVLAEGKTATLDLNGKKILGGLQPDNNQKHIYPLDVYGSLTICDSSNGGYIEGRGIYVQNGAKFTVNSGSIYAIDSNGGSAIWQYGGDVVINGGLIEKMAEGTYNFAINGLNGTITVEGGKIAGNHGAIATEAAVVVLNAGEFVCTGTEGFTDNVLYSYNSGSITINGGTFTADKDIPAGGCCVYDANGGVTINGGVFGHSSGGDVWGITGGTVIKGGKFENLTETQHIAEGYVMNENGEVVAK